MSRTTNSCQSLSPLHYVHRSAHLFARKTIASSIFWTHEISSSNTHICGHLNRRCHGCSGCLMCCFLILMNLTKNRLKMRHFLKNKTRFFSSQSSCQPWLLPVVELLWCDGARCDICAGSRENACMNSVLCSRLHVMCWACRIWRESLFTCRPPAAAAASKAHAWPISCWTAAENIKNVTGYF